MYMYIIICLACDIVTLSVCIPTINLYYCKMQCIDDLSRFGLF